MMKMGAALAYIVFLKFHPIVGLIYDTRLCVDDNFVCRGQSRAPSARTRFARVATGLGSASRARCARNRASRRCAVTL